ncbi:MAG: glycosyltransferase [Candidatus Taylorbacteria bacterium]|nr:glycosyltransferase [Candidatus Taylorbacteria bacterium]
MTPAPIALFVYNRPEHTRKTIEALRANTLAGESELFIFSDGPKNTEQKKAVREVRDYIKTITGFRRIEIVERAENFALSKSIISGVTDIVNRYSKIIVMEDDLVTSPYFLKYMNEGLELYKNEKSVASIHGYVYPSKKTLPETFFLRGADCWGWATWKRAWKAFELDGNKLLIELEKKGLISKFDLDGTYDFSATLKRQIDGRCDSWAIRWHASAFLVNMLTLYPGRSLVNNIGRDGSGTHAGDTGAFNTVMTERPIEVRPIPIEEDAAARKIIIGYMRSLRTSLFKRIKTKITGRR